jgi:hypothetical protein
MSQPASRQFARRFRAVVVSLIAIASVTAASHANPAMAAPIFAEGSGEQTQVTLLGDSTMAGMEWYQYDSDDADTAANNDIREIIGAAYDLTFSAESCRRIVATSCVGRFGTRPASVLPYMQSTLNGHLGQALVIMAGYDDVSISNAVDLVMAEAEAQGVLSVVWLTYRTGTNYVLPGGTAAKDLYQSHNAELQRAASRHATLHVLDWNGFTADKAAWFAADGIHLNPSGAIGLAQYIKASLDQQQSVIGRCRNSVALTGVPDDGSIGSAAPVADRTGFVPMVPTRVLDTRENTPGVNGKLGAHRTVAVDLGGVVPNDATSAVLSVTAVEGCVAGFLTVFPCGPRPGTSNVNYEIGRTTAGMAISTMTDHEVCVFASTATDVVVDVIGSFTPGGQPFHPMTPTRFVDTRGEGSLQSEVLGEKVTSNDTRIAVRDQAGIPTTATAVWVNLTVANPASSTVLTVYPGPCGSAPLASTVNARNQHDTASAALVGIGSDGTICVRTYSGRSHVVVDVAGWFGPGAGGLRYQPQSANRLLDTRMISSAPTMAEQQVPLASTAVLNVTSADATGAGYVTVRPCGGTATSSLVNATRNEDTANVIAVSPGSGGSVCVRSSVASQFVVDQIGSFVL